MCVEKLKTPVFIGGTVLDNSKHLMYDFEKRYGRHIFGEDMHTAYMDTDFDLSNYPVEHQLYSKENKKVSGNNYE